MGERASRDGRWRGGPDQGERAWTATANARVRVRIVGAARVALTVFEGETDRERRISGSVSDPNQNTLDALARGTNDTLGAKVTVTSLIDNAKACTLAGPFKL